MINTIWLETASEESMTGYVFGLDPQLIIDTIIVVIAVFGLFLLLSYLLFNPARELLRKRQEKIKNEMDSAAKEKEDALKFKTEYEGKLDTASEEVNRLIEEGRKKAQKRENEIIEEAKLEAAKIRQRAEKEIELEKSRVKDEIKQEMVAVASLMAEKYVAGEMTAERQEQLLNEALNEMGEQG